MEKTAPLPAAKPPSPSAFYDEFMAKYGESVLAMGRVE
jgi:hypothetical protein